MKTERGKKMDTQKIIEKNTEKVKRGRPRKIPGELKLHVAFTLSKAAIDKIDTIAKRYGFSASQAVEFLITHRYEILERREKK